MSKVWVWITYALLTAAAVFAVLALMRNPDFDRASIALALGASVTGLVISRLVAARERRRELLRALVHELYTCINAFSNSELSPTNIPIVPRTYPRLATVCLEACLASGAFTEASDRGLLKALHDWHLRASEFNQKLGITEMNTLTVAGADLVSWHRNVTSSPVTEATKQALGHLAKLLMDRYSKESRIAHDTVLFGQ